MRTEKRKRKEEKTKRKKNVQKCDNSHRVTKLNRESIHTVCVYTVQYVIIALSSHSWSSCAEWVSSTQYAVWCACVDGISFTLKFIARTRMTHDSVTCTEHLSHSLCISRFKYSMKFFDAIFFAFFFFFFIFFGEFFAFRFYRLLLVVVMFLSHMCYVVWCMGYWVLNVFRFFSFFLILRNFFVVVRRDDWAKYVRNVVCVHLEQTQYNFIRCCFVHFKYIFRKVILLPLPPLNPDTQQQQQIHFSFPFWCLLSFRFLCGCFVQTNVQHIMFSAHIALPNVIFISLHRAAAADKTTQSRGKSRNAFAHSVSVCRGRQAGRQHRKRQRDTTQLWHKRNTNEKETKKKQQFFLYFE